MNISQYRSIAAALLVALTSAVWASDLQLVPVTRLIPERGAVNSAQITSGAWRGSIILPAGWRLGSSKDKVLMQSQDASARIEMRVATGNQKPSVEQLRGQVLNGGSASRLVSEYQWSTPAGRATVFEVEQAAGENLRLFTRTMFIQQESGMLEFKLTAVPDKYAASQKVFENLVASVRKI